MNVVSERLPNQIKPILGNEISVLGNLTKEFLKTTLTNPSRETFEEAWSLFSCMIQQNRRTYNPEMNHPKGYSDSIMARFLGGREESEHSLKHEINQFRSFLTEKPDYFLSHYDKLSAEDKSKSQEFMKLMLSSIDNWLSGIRIPVLNKIVYSTNN